MKKTSNKIEVLDKIEKVTYITHPSPVVLVSTISKDGINNIAPFAMFMNCSTKPHMIALGISPISDTYKNIIDTNEFVVSIPNEEILKEVYQSGNKYDPEENEFDITGLTPYKSNNVKASRVMESAVNIDCTLESHTESGNHYIVVGKVIGVDMEEDLFCEDSVNLRLNIPKTYHLTGNKFLVNNKLKEIEL